MNSGTGGRRALELRQVDEIHSRTRRRTGAADQPHRHERTRPISKDSVRARFPALDRFPSPIGSSFWRLGLSACTGTPAARALCAAEQIRTNHAVSLETWRARGDGLQDSMEGRTTPRRLLHTSATTTQRAHGTRQVRVERPDHFRRTGAAGQPHRHERTRPISKDSVPARIPVHGRIRIPIDLPLWR